MEIKFKVGDLVKIKSPVLPKYNNMIGKIASVYSWYQTGQLISVVTIYGDNIGGLMENEVEFVKDKKALIYYG